MTSGFFLGRGLSDEILSFFLQRGVFVPLIFQGERFSLEVSAFLFSAVFFSSPSVFWRQDVGQEWPAWGMMWSSVCTWKMLCQRWGPGDVGESGDAWGWLLVLAGRSLADGCFSPLLPGRGLIWQVCLHGLAMPI